MVSLDSLIIYMDSHEIEVEESYFNDKVKYLNIANFVITSLPKCNINSLDVPKMSIYLRVIKSIVSKNEIHTNLEYLRLTFEYVVLNIILIKNHVEEDFVFELVQLFEFVLSKISEEYPDSALDKDRLFQALCSLLEKNGKLSGIVLNIVKILFNIKGNNDSKHLHSLMKMILNLIEEKQEVETFYDFAEISWNQLGDVGEETAKRIIQYVLLNSAQNIEKGNLNLKTRILTNILILISVNRPLALKIYPDLMADLKNLLNFFVKISNKLCDYCCENHQIATVARKVLTMTLLNFFENENMDFAINENIFEQVYGFFEQMSGCGLNAPNKYFIHLCHMMVKHNSLIWPPHKVLQTIMRYFQNQDYQIDTLFFKSIFYLFSRLIIYSETDLSTIQWSSQILRMMTFLSANPGIYSFCKEQLAWILTMGNSSLKTETVKHWIVKQEHREILSQVVIECNSMNFVLKLMTEQYADDYGQLASEVLKKLDVKQKLQLELSEKLFIINRDKKFFKYLILSDPGIPRDESKRLLLLELVLTMIPATSDECLIASCFYCRRLIKKLRRNPECLAFLENGKSSIKFLFGKFEENTTENQYEILKFIVDFLELQKSTTLGHDLMFEIQFISLLNRKSNLINRSLSIIPKMMNRMNVIEKLPQHTILNLWCEIMNFLDLELGNYALDSILAMIMNVEWLNLTSSMTSLIRYLMVTKLSQGSNWRILRICRYWLDKVMKYPEFLRPPIPSYDMNRLMLICSESQGKY